MITKKLPLFLLAVTAMSVSVAQTTYYSRNAATAPRNWDEADSWTLNADGSGAAAAIPGRNDNIVILNGHTIVVNNMADNGSTATSANALGLANVGTFNGSGSANFYQVGNITINSGGTLTSNQRMMLAGSVLVHGTLETTSAGDDLIILGRLEVSSSATLSLTDDFVLTGNSETLLFNTTSTGDDIYIDHTDAELCGSGIVDIGDAIQYLNGATSDQICGDITITGCGTCPLNGTGNNGISTDQKLIKAGSVWRYLDDGSNQGTAWRGTSFDDSSWASDQAQLGYGDGDETTVVGFGPDANNKYQTTYFRKSFYVPDPNDYSTVLLRLLRDDGAVVYINGVEVDRQNMAAGTVTYTTFANATVSGSGEDTFIETTLASSVLTAGTNHVAVEIHQRNLSSSDISFDLELIGQFGNALVSKQSTWNYLDDGSNQGTAWRNPSFNDSGWASGAGVLGYGDSQSTVVSFGGDANNKHETTYFRHSFTVPDASIYSSLTINLLRDDGAVVYLNGTEVLRDNMPAGAITFTTLAPGTITGEDEDNYNSFNVSSASLVNGANVLAVEIHQRAVNSSDISFDMEVIGIENNPLPVSWMTFDAEVVNNQVELYWSTASELNNDYFEIERSLDGKFYEKIAKVEGSGTTTSVSNYQYTDARPHAGVNYYRLRQVDYDGQFEYSTIQKAIVYEGLTLYPNPADQVLNIYTKETIDVDKIEVIDLNGRTLTVNKAQKDGLIKIEISQLKRGYYIVKVKSADDFERNYRVLVTH
ncbi:T9SS type A sorting domain-containing protein [Fulvivirga sp. RKSG066]|uniref:T9SS type A sorting domain-containing protein n=1 Tax=Fulvivirga aurantia TaxID=2529383 RepID=UPI0012BD80C8|nr:T9SS type A sorting domain-containing protein [Fulvivirga aurantia]MTI22887.1 T9SS type A sorting domain-containing protein [Fulvivirga aurantia]